MSRLNPNSRWKPRPRTARGRFIKKQVVMSRLYVDESQMAAAMIELYKWRDARRDYAVQLAAIKQDESRIGLRSLFIFAAFAGALALVLIGGVA